MGLGRSLSWGTKALSPRINIQKEKERDKNSVGNIDICCPTENGGDGGRELEGNHVGGTGRGVAAAFRM